MGSVSVMSKGQVTIPKRVRQALGITPGSKVEFYGVRLKVMKVRKPSSVKGGAAILGNRLRRRFAPLCQLRLRRASDAQVGVLCLRVAIRSCRSRQAFYAHRQESGAAKSRSPKGTILSPS